MKATRKILSPPTLTMSEERVMPRPVILIIDTMIWAPAKQNADDQQPAGRIFEGFGDLFVKPPARSAMEVMRVMGKAINAAAMP